MSFTAYYDLMCCPASFDVVSFLMLAERKRLQKGADSVAIEILPGPWEGFRRDHHWPYTIPERTRLLTNVVVPMCQGLPSARSVVVHDRRPSKAPDSIGYAEYSMSFKEFTDTYAMGVRPLHYDLGKAGERSDKKTITITLRESEHWPERNSNLVEWLLVQEELTYLGYETVVVRDAAQVDTPLGSPYGLVNPDASTNLRERARLYCSCDLNLFVNNGPAWFALALDAPAIIFKPTAETNCWAHTAAAMKEYGIIKDKQMRGRPNHQMLSWELETAENIVREVQNFFRYQEYAKVGIDPFNVNPDGSDYHLMDAIDERLT